MRTLASFITFIVLLKLNALAAPSVGALALPANAILPAWPKPALVQLKGALSIHSKDLELVHSTGTFGGFIVRVGGKPMAIGHNRPLIGYVAEESLRWLDLAQAANRKLTVRSHRGALR